MKKGIYIVATPIGNLGDISKRALEVLQSADVVACEDTRVTKKLFNLLGLDTHKEFLRLEDHNEAEQSQKLVEKALSGHVIAQVSDAGSPLISDPGYKLIRACKKNGVDVYAIPGPCALICALQLSGLPTNSFMFAGFIPNKDKARKDVFQKLQHIDTTLIFYETSNRLLKSLSAMSDVFKEREVSVAREITKIYEECKNGTAAELFSYYSENEPKGEIVVMVAPPSKQPLADINIEDIVRQELQENSLKTAVKNIVNKYKLNKKMVYDLALRIKDE